MSVRQLSLWFYVIIFLSQFGTVLTFANPQTKCGALLNGEVTTEVDRAWDDLKQTYENYFKKALKPPEGLVLDQTKKWANALSQQLAGEGYQSILKLQPERTDLPFLVPERWIVQITKGTDKTWLGQQIEHGTREYEADFYFDFFGLLQNNSHAAADYDGRSHIVFSEGIYKERFDDYVEGIEHELQHAFDHMQLKNKLRGGFYAEVNMVLDPATTSPDVIAPYFLTPEYRYFFNFGEILAFELDYRDSVKRLQKLTPGTPEYDSLVTKKEYYRRNVWAFLNKAIELTENALANKQNEKVQERTKFLRDPDHRNYTAHIPIFDTKNNLQPYELTIWILFGQTAEKSTANFMMANYEVKTLLSDLKAYREMLMTTLPLSP